MTPSPRAARSLDEALSQALDDLEAGLSPIQVLDRYPQYETELAPLLETAHRLRTSRWPTLSMAARVAGRERMHAALTEQRARRRFLVPPIWRQVGAGVALVLLAGTTYFASPISPLRPTTRPGLTPTVVPAGVMSTWTVAPSATFEQRATVFALATPVPSPTIRVRNTAEPTDAFDRAIFWTSTTRDAQETIEPTAAATRAKPTRAAVATLPATPLSTFTASPVVERPSEPPATSVAPEPATATARPPTASPSATAAQPATPTATRVKPPTATRTASPSDEPDPTATPTIRPSATPVPPTKTPRPSPTAQPTVTNAPEPSATPIAPLPTRTRRPTQTPEASPTPKPEPTGNSDAPPNPGKYLRDLRDSTRLAVGLEVRSVLEEWRKAELPRVRTGRP